MSEIIIFDLKERRDLRGIKCVWHHPSLICVLVKVYFSLNLLFLTSGATASFSVDANLMEENDKRGLLDLEEYKKEAENSFFNVKRRQEEDSELMEEIRIFAPEEEVPLQDEGAGLVVEAEQTKHVSYLEEMQVTMEKTTHVLSQGTDDSWVPAVSAMVIVLIVFSISVFACCLHCPFCCVYRMNDPHRIV